MKWLIVLGLLFILAFFIYSRYRRQINAARQFWRMYRQMRQASATPEKKIEKKETGSSQPLVRCARCGKWISPSEALKLGKNVTYCSTDCMEKSARLESLVDR